MCEWGTVHSVVAGGGVAKVGGRKEEKVGKK